MRQAADILSSAPAMQIRYLEAMQAMAKSANSKVIFLPGSNQGLGEALKNSVDPTVDVNSAEGQDSTGLQTALNARMVENI